MTKMLKYTNKKGKTTGVKAAKNIKRRNGLCSPFWLKLNFVENIFTKASYKTEIFPSALQNIVTPKTH